MNGNLSCGRRQFSPLPPKVTLTKLWMKMSRLWQRFTWNVSPLPLTPPAPAPPHSLPLLPAPSPMDTWNLCTAGGVNRRRQSMYCEGSSLEERAHDFMENLFFIWERKAAAAEFASCLCLEIWRWKHSPGLSFCLTDLLLFITFSLEGKKRKVKGI